MTTTKRAEVIHPSLQLARTLRVSLLLLIGGDLGLIAVRLLHYPTFFSMPGALGYALTPLVALAVYAALIVVLPQAAARLPGAPAAVRVGIVIGLIGGGLELMSISIESLFMLPQRVVSVTSLIEMLILFLSFAVAGFVGSRRTGAFWLGIGTAIWSAMVAILVAVAFGFLLVNTSLSTLAHDEQGDPDYARSGWSDVRAFAIANTFDSGFTHLVEAPIIATLLGAAGSGLGQIGVRRRLAPVGSSAAPGSM
jgi:hypothetical protein